jgi:hypothetical protein
VVEVVVGVVVGVEVGVVVEVVVGVVVEVVVGVGVVVGVEVWVVVEVGVSAPLVPIDLWGVVVRDFRTGEWLDYGSLRATPEESRAAWGEFYAKAMGGWREANKPNAVRRFTLVEKEK